MISVTYSHDGRIFRCADGYLYLSDGQLEMWAETYSIPPVCLAAFLRELQERLEERGVIIGSGVRDGLPFLRGCLRKGQRNGRLEEIINYHERLEAARSLRKAFLSSLPGAADPALNLPGAADPAPNPAVNPGANPATDPVWAANPDQMAAMAQAAGLVPAWPLAPQLSCRTEYQHERQAMRRAYETVESVMRGIKDNDTWESYTGRGVAAGVCNG